MRFVFASDSPPIPPPDSFPILTRFVFIQDLLHQDRFPEKLPAPKNPPEIEMLLVPRKSLTVRTIL